VNITVTQNNTSKSLKKYQSWMKIYLLITLTQVRWT